MSTTTPATQQGLSYKDAGVDIEAGNYLVQQIKSLVKSTSRPGVVGSIGGFGALFDLSQTGFKDKNPILVSGTDGVGTKLKLALSLKKFDTIGIDLVAMCVNDILVQGAEPLFFLDYFACGKLDPDVARQVLVGVASGCRDSLCALVGGETAEMPGMYADDDFDLAGFSVGAVEKEQMLPRLDRIADDDVIIGLPSSGVHSNGYSMVRKVLEISCTSLEDQTPFDTSKTFGQVLLTPTRLYVKSLLPIIQKFGQQVVALCHITGGGLVENIPRILPEDKCAELDGSSWQPHPIFDWLHQTGKVVEEEMLRTFNCGLGMVVIVKRDFADAILKEIKQEEPNAVVVGFIRPRVGQAVVIKNVSKLITPLDAIAPKPSTPKKRVAVLISGSGSNLQALIDHTRNPAKQSQAEIVLVISNKDNVKGLERARANHIPIKVISHVPYKDNREAYDRLLDDELVRCRADFVFLAGFMRILSNEFVAKWEGRLVNIHPALLPAFPGMNTHRRALEAGVQFHGTTVHFVDTGVDTGAIIRQRVVEIFPEDTEETLQEKVKQAEHRLYPEVMELLVRNKIRLNKRLQWN